MKRDRTLLYCFCMILIFAAAVDYKLVKIEKSIMEIRNDRK